MHTIVQFVYSYSIECTEGGDIGRVWLSSLLLTLMTVSQDCWSTWCNRSSQYSVVASARSVSASDVSVSEILLCINCVNSSQLGILSPRVITVSALLHRCRIYCILHFATGANSSLASDLCFAVPRYWVALLSFTRFTCRRDPPLFTTTPHSFTTYSEW